MTCIHGIHGHVSVARDGDGWCEDHAGRIVQCPPRCAACELTEEEVGALGKEGCCHDCALYLDSRCVECGEAEGRHDVGYGAGELLCDSCEEARWARVKSGAEPLGLQAARQLGPEVWSEDDDIAF